MASTATTPGRGSQSQQQRHEQNQTGAMNGNGGASSEFEIRRQMLVEEIGDVQFPAYS